MECVSVNEASFSSQPLLCNADSELRERISSKGTPCVRDEDSAQWSRVVCTVALKMSRFAEGSGPVERGRPAQDVRIIGTNLRNYWKFRTARPMSRSNLFFDVDRDEHRRTLHDTRTQRTAATQHIFCSPLVAHRAPFAHQGARPHTRRICLPRYRRIRGAESCAGGESLSEITKGWF